MSIRRSRAWVAIDRYVRRLEGDGSRRDEKLRRMSMPRLEMHGEIRHQDYDAVIAR
jgi:hypothetical protein